MLTDNVGGPAQATCASTGTTITLNDTTTMVTQNQVVLVFLTNGLWTARQVTNVVAGTAACGAVLTIATGSGATVGGAFNPAGGVCAPFGAGGAVIGNAYTDTAGCIVSHISTGELVGYRVRNTNGVPFLERRSSRSVQDAGTGNAWDQAWQQMVPGIEDLQVGYQNVGTALPGPAASPEPFAATPGAIPSPRPRCRRFQPPDPARASHALGAVRSPEPARDDHKRPGQLRSWPAHEHRHPELHDRDSQQEHSGLRTAAVPMRDVMRQRAEEAPNTMQDLKKSHPKTGEGGFALILAILALLLLTFLGLTLAATTSTELQIATNYRWSQQALYNARSGPRGRQAGAPHRGLGHRPARGRGATWGTGHTTAPTALLSRNDKWGNATRNFENGSPATRSEAGRASGSSSIPAPATRTRPISSSPSIAPRA